MRHALVKKAFSKGYKPQWSRYLYRVRRVIHRIDKTAYEIYKISSRKVFKKKFYQEELSKVTFNLSKIERIIRKRTKKGARQLLVEVKDNTQYLLNSKNIKDIAITMYMYILILILFANKHANILP